MASQQPQPAAAVLARSESETDAEKEVRLPADEKSGASSPRLSDSLKENLNPEDPEDGIFRQVITKDGKDVLVTWTKEEQAKVVRKADFLFLPLFSVMFTWMAIDRANVSGVLTSTFLKDTNMTRDQANTGVSLLWLGIVLLEIPSNIVLHRIGPHYWIPAQVVIWGLIEVLQCFVTGPSGWYAARLFLGLAESGFLPGSLYTLSQWYTQDEIATRTTAFFFGASIASAFGSLISSGALLLEGKQGILGWQWIFIICGVSTIATGILAFAFLPKSPYHTGNLFSGLIKVRGWFSEREADVFTARIIRKDNNKKHTSSMTIKWSDISAVLLNWATWPYLIACLSGLQSINGLGTWGATIIKSLGFSSITANLLNAPGPIIAGTLGLVLSSLVDRYKRYGYAILFVGIWTLAGIIALYHLPVTSKTSWSFYAAYLVTQASPSWQPINVTWLSLNFKSPQQRAIAYAVYMGCSNLGGTYGNQVFRGSDAPLYHKAWIACLSLAAVWIATVLAQTTVFQLANRRFRKQVAAEPELEAKAVWTDGRGRLARYYW